MWKLFLALILGMTIVNSAQAQLVFTTPSVDFGKIEIGNSSPPVGVLLLNTSGESVVVNCLGGGASPSQFSTAQICQGKTLDPGETCPFIFSFTPAVTGVLSGTSGPTCNSISLSVNLIGEGVLPKLMFATPTVDFGLVAVGTASPSISVDLINRGAAPVTMSCSGGGASQPQFSSSQFCQGETLNPGDSCPFIYNFMPDALGNFTANSNVYCNGVNLTAQLQGEGLLPALVVDTPAVDFGTVEVSISSPNVNVNLRNQSPDPVTLTCAGGGASQPQFAVGQACHGSILNSGDTCAWSFSFTPDAIGEVTGASNFGCNGVGFAVALRGEGVSDLPDTGLSFDASSVDFGEIEIGNSSPTITVDLRNTGGDPVVVNCFGGGASPLQFSSSQNCQGQTLDPGETCPFIFDFIPAVTGVLNGSSIAVCNSIPLSVNLTGEGVLPQLRFATPSVDFGPVTVGTTSPSISVDLTNNGTAPVTVSCVGGGASQPQFATAQLCQGQTLNPGDSCPFIYDFMPDATGIFIANSNAFCNGVSLTAQLHGEGRLPALIIDTPAVDFGVVEVNTTSPAVHVNLRNQGPNPVTINCAGGGASQPQFATGQVCQGSILNTGNTCSWSFTFTPDAIGEVTGVSNFACNGVGFIVTLKGGGVPNLLFADGFE